MDADCASNQLAITYIRHYVSNPFSESWKLYLPDTTNVLYSSEQIPMEGTTTDTICVEQTNFFQYDLELLSLSSVVMSNSWFAINGTYNNRIFKSSWRAGRIRLSFYTPIDHEMSWFWTTNYSPDWKTCSTNSWTLTSGNSIPSSSVSVHYFRRSFTGLSNMAAYESQFYYRDGLVAYLNGYEIYRDNMGIGPILPSTKPTSSYIDYSYRGVIRNGFDVSESECIVSVEIHLSNSVSFQFHSWLSIYASSLPRLQTENCYPVPVVRGKYGYVQSGEHLYDYWYESLLYLSYLAADSFIEYEVSLAQVNQWEAYEGVGYCPASRAIMEVKMTRDDAWTRMRPSYPVRANTLQYYFFSFPSYNYRSYSMYKFTITESSCTPVYIWELHPLTCYEPYTIQRAMSVFDATYTLSVGQKVNIVASNDNVIGCLTDTALPSGLSFDGCSIVGSPTESVTDLRLRIYWQDDFGTLSQEVIINVLKSGLNNLFILYGVIGVVIVVIALVLWLRCRSKKRELPTSTVRTVEPIGHKAVVPPPVPPALEDPSQPVNPPHQDQEMDHARVAMKSPEVVNTGIAMKTPIRTPDDSMGVSRDTTENHPAVPMSTPISTPMRAPIVSSMKTPMKVPLPAQDNPPIRTSNSIPIVDMQNTPMSVPCGYIVNPAMHTHSLDSTTVPPHVSSQSFSSYLSTSSYVPIQQPQQRDQTNIDRNGHTGNTRSLSTQEVIYYVKQ